MRIGIVNDLEIALVALRRVIEANPELKIAWEARDGHEAIGLAEKDLPDIILMDLIMPVMDGVEATRIIMEETPTNIIIVTATVEGNSNKVFEAMGYGALDAVCTPTIDGNHSLNGAHPLLKKINNVAQLILKDSNPLPIQKQPIPTQPTTHESLIAIGASTGGPQALAFILSSLPADFQTPIIIVQHVDKNFASGLATWLDKNTPLNINIIQNNQTILPNHVYIASTEHHLILSENQTLQYTPHPKDLVFRPSIDVFFQSLASNYKKAGLAIILTGMGQDGANGLLKLRQSKWYTIAQDPKTAVVPSMPQSTINNNAACEAIPLENIPNTILQHAHYSSA